MGVTEQLEDDETFEQVKVNINLLGFRQIECLTYSGDMNFHFLGCTHDTNSGKLQIVTKNQ